MTAASLTRLAAHDLPPDLNAAAAASALSAAAAELGARTARNAVSSRAAQSGGSDRAAQSGGSEQVRGNMSGTHTLQQGGAGSRVYSSSQEVNGGSTAKGAESRSSDADAAEHHGWALQLPASMAKPVKDALKTAGWLDTSK